MHAICLLYVCYICLLSNILTRKGQKKCITKSHVPLFNIIHYAWVQNYFYHKFLLKFQLQLSTKALKNCYSENWRKLTMYSMAFKCEQFPQKNTSRIDDWAQNTLLVIMAESVFRKSAKIIWKFQYVLWNISTAKCFFAKKDSIFLGILQKLQSTFDNFFKEW